MVTESFARDTGIIRRYVRVNGIANITEIEDRSDPSSDSPAAWWQSFLRGAPVVVSNLRRVLRIIDTFSGCGGFSLGTSQAAVALGATVETVAAVDLDTKALEVYQENFSPERILLRNAASLVDFHVTAKGNDAFFPYPPEVIDDQLLDQVGHIDLFLAGPPCQGHSNLNNRSRRDDPRNLLYLTAVALATALRSRAVILENVPEVLNDKTGVIQTAKALLRNAGYQHIDQGILAVDELGGAQTRRRLFVVALRDSPTDGIASLADVGRSLRKEPSPLHWAISDLTNVKPEGIMHTVPALSSENRRRIDFLFDNDFYDLPDLERPECHQEGTTYKSVYGRLRWDRPAQTITTGFLTPGRGRFIHPSNRRVLTPQEAARIQSFPDTFNFCTDPAIEPSRNLLSKWIGDAVPPMLGYAAALPAVAALID
jgi:DNA (cytosine-5)-methyltransferase 1